MSEIQEKYENSQLYRIRHSAAHIMAQAVVEMFEPGEAKYRHWSAYREWFLL